MKKNIIPKLLDQTIDEDENVGKQLSFQIQILEKDLECYDERSVRSLLDRILEEEQRSTSSLEECIKTEFLSAIIKRIKESHLEPFAERILLFLAGVLQLEGERPNVGRAHLACLEALKTLVLRLRGAVFGQQAVAGALGKIIPEVLRILEDSPEQREDYTISALEVMVAFLEVASPQLRPYMGRLEPALLFNVQQSPSLPVTLLAGKAVGRLPLVGGDSLIVGRTLVRLMTDAHRLLNKAWPDPDSEPLLLPSNAKPLLVPLEEDEASGDPQIVTHYFHSLMTIACEVLKIRHSGGATKLPLNLMIALIEKTMELEPAKIKKGKEKLDLLPVADGALASVDLRFILPTIKASSANLLLVLLNIGKLPLLPSLRRINSLCVQTFEVIEGTDVVTALNITSAMAQCFGEDMPKDLIGKSVPILAKFLKDVVGFSTTNTLVEAAKGAAGKGKGAGASASSQQGGGNRKATSRKRKRAELNRLTGSSQASNKEKQPVSADILHRALQAQAAIDCSQKLLLFARPSLTVQTRQLLGGILRYGLTVLSGQATNSQHDPMIRCSAQIKEAFLKLVMIEVMAPMNDGSRSGLLSAAAAAFKTCLLDSNAKVQQQAAVGMLVCDCLMNARAAPLHIPPDILTAMVKGVGEATFPGEVQIENAKESDESDSDGSDAMNHDCALTPKDFDEVSKPQKEYQKILEQLKVQIHLKGEELTSLEAKYEAQRKECQSTLQLLEQEKQSAATLKGKLAEYRVVTEETVKENRKTMQQEHKAQMKEAENAIGELVIKVKNVQEALKNQGDDCVNVSNSLIGHSKKKSAVTKEKPTIDKKKEGKLGESILLQLEDEDKPNMPAKQKLFVDEASKATLEENGDAHSNDDFEFPMIVDEDPDSDQENI